MYFLLYIFFAFQVPFNALEVIHTVFILKVLTFKLKKNISFSILQWNNSFWFRLCKIGYLAHFYFLLFFTSHSLPLPAWFCPCNLVFSTLIIPLGKSNFFSYIMYFLLGELFLDIQINSIFFYALVFLCHDFLLYSWVLIQQYMYEQFLLSEQITWVVSFLPPLYLRTYFWALHNCMTTWLSIEFLNYKHPQNSVGYTLLTCILQNCIILRPAWV